jgi:hypothetical protein
MSCYDISSLTSSIIEIIAGLGNSMKFKVGGGAF